MADIVVPIVVENLIKLLAYEANLLGGVEDGVISLKGAEQSLQRRRRNVEEDDVVGFEKHITTLINQLTNQSNIRRNIQKAVEDLKAELHEHLKGKTYLIVMDDIWSTQVWEDLRVAFPNKSNGSRILITSREREVGWHASPTPLMSWFLDENESWELAKEGV
ncbi:hypothetical protein FNV43_RR20362 [Rhamnella rubrinervis]|uniref:NB-ARC domain-containing protein n=1 Tax=Rhamnella rubrinervis TaxID=2594499 RepID=A0A8K0GU42_9ROSA|nr:hypothetical protein FNV43_RR20362 [Rhamnella rubrinervis]